MYYASIGSETNFPDHLFTLTTTREIFYVLTNPFGLARVRTLSTRVAALMKKTMNYK